MSSKDISNWKEATPLSVRKYVKEQKRTLWYDTSIKFPGRANSLIDQRQTVSTRNLTQSLKSSMPLLPPFMKISKNSNSNFMGTTKWKSAAVEKLPITNSVQKTTEAVIQNNNRQQREAITAIAANESNKKYVFEDNLNHRKNGKVTITKEEIIDYINVNYVISISNKNDKIESPKESHVLVIPGVQSDSSLFPVYILPETLAKESRTLKHFIECSVLFKESGDIFYLPEVDPDTFSITLYLFLQLPKLPDAESIRYLFSMKLLSSLLYLNVPSLVCCFEQMVTSYPSVLTEESSFWLYPPLLLETLLFQMSLACLLTVDKALDNAVLDSEELRQKYRNYIQAAAEKRIIISLPSFDIQKSSIMQWAAGLVLKSWLLHWKDMGTILPEDELRQIIQHHRPSLPSLTLRYPVPLITWDYFQTTPKILQELSLMDLKWNNDVEKVVRSFLRDKSTLSLDIRTNFVQYNDANTSFPSDIILHDQNDTSLTHTNQLPGYLQTSENYDILNLSPNANARLTITNIDFGSSMASFWLLISNENCVLLDLKISIDNIPHSLFVNLPSRWCSLKQLTLRIRNEYSSGILAVMTALANNRSILSISVENVDGSIVDAPSDIRDWVKQFAYGVLRERKYPLIKCTLLNCPFSVGEMLMMSVSFSSLQSLVFLSLEGCNIGVYGFRQVVENLSACNKIESINLRRNQLTKRCWYQLSPTAVRFLSQLKSLDLGDNPWDLESLYTFVAAFEFSCQWFQLVLSNENSRILLDLKWIQNLLSLAPNLKSLNVTGNVMDSNNTICNLINTILHHPSLDTLTIKGALSRNCLSDAKFWTQLQERVFIANDASEISNKNIIVDVSNDDIDYEGYRPFVSKYFKTNYVAVLL